jgi:HSP20 family protein
LTDRATLEPTNPSSWRQSLGLPSLLFGEGYTGSSDYDLYEEDGEFVLSIDVPGFDREEFDLMWDDGVRNVAAEHVDEDRGRTRTYHRRFRFPKDVDTGAISAFYTNGVLPPDPGGHRTARRAHPDRKLRAADSLVFRRDRPTTTEWGDRDRCDGRGHSGVGTASGRTADVTKIEGGPCRDGCAGRALALSPVRHHERRPGIGRRGTP